MKKYKVDDFKTFFAKQEFIRRDKDIDWDLLEKYSDTDINEQIKRIFQKITKYPEDVPLDWFVGHPDIQLSNGECLPASVMNCHVHSGAEHTSLALLEALESCFSKTINPEEIIKNITDSLERGVDRPLYAIVFFPVEATHIYFECRFFNQIHTPQGKIITDYIDEQLALNGIDEPGPTSFELTPSQVSELVELGWKQMGGYIEQTLIPQIKTAPKPPGPSGMN